MNFEAFTDDIVKNKWNVFGTEVYEKGEDHGQKASYHVCERFSLQSRRRQLA